MFTEKFFFAALSKPRESQQFGKIIKYLIKKKNIKKCLFTFYQKIARFLNFYIKKN